MLDGRENTIKAKGMVAVSVDDFAVCLLQRGYALRLCFLSWIRSNGKGIFSTRRRYSCVDFFAHERRERIVRKCIRCASWVVSWNTRCRVQYIHEKSEDYPFFFARNTAWEKQSRCRVKFLKISEEGVLRLYFLYEWRFGTITINFNKKSLSWFGIESS